MKTDLPIAEMYVCVLLNQLTVIHKTRYERFAIRRYFNLVPLNFLQSAITTQHTHELMAWE